MNPAKPKTGERGVEAVLINIDQDGSATFVTPGGVSHLHVPQSLREQVQAARGRAVRVTVRDGSVSGITRLARSADWYFDSISRLSEEQGTRPVQAVDDLKADFWPEWQSVDDFIAAAKGKSAT